MKKTLAFFIAFAIILALTPALSFAAGAALSPVWCELVPFDVDGVPNSGDVSVGEDGIVLKVAEGGWWPQAGVKYADPVKIDGLEIVFNASAFTYESPNGYFAVTLSSKPIGDFGVPSIVGARAYGAVPESGSKAVSVTFHSGGLEMLVTDGGTFNGFARSATPDVTASEDVTLSFFNTEKGFGIRVNGEEYRYNGEDVSEALSLIGDPALSGGKAYLSITAVGYGVSGSERIAVKTVNGVAANKWRGEEKRADRGHEGKWVVTKYPTGTETGERRRLCLVCGVTETETIPAIKINDFTFSEDGGALTLTAYNGGAEEVFVPAEAGGLPVVAVGEQAFYNRDNIKNVTVPAGVVSIGDRAFSGCASLVGVSLPEGVTEIGGSAFSDCGKLEDVNLPESLKTVGDRAFYGCASLKNVIIPDGVVKVGWYAFSGCAGLERAMIGSGLTEIARETFYGCANLKSVNVPEGVSYIGLKAFYGCAALESFCVPASVSCIDGEAFKDCFSLKTVYNCGDLPITAGETARGRVAYYADEVVVHKAHDFGDFVVASAATCAEEGAEARICSVCGLIGAPTAAIGWDVLTPYDADGAGASVGAFSVTDGGFLSFDVAPGHWWPQAGVVSEKAVDPAGLEITVNCPEFTDPSPNGYFMIILSAEKPGSFGLEGPLYGRSYDVSVDRNKAVCLSFFAGLYYAFEGVVYAEGESWEGVSEATPYADAEIKFVDFGDHFRIIANGAYLKSNGDFVIVPKSAVTNAEGKSFLTFAAVGYGGSGTDGPITVKYINGAPANAFGYAAPMSDYVRAVPTLGHDWEEWTVERVPSVELTGVLVRSCRRDAAHVERVSTPVVTSDEFTYDSANGKYSYEAGGKTLYFDYLSDGPRILGAQYRTVGPAGIRFCTELPLTVNNGDLSFDADRAAALENIEAFGTLIMPSDLLDDPSDLVLTANGKIRSQARPSGAEYLNVVGEKLYNVFSDRIHFTAVVIGIPNAAPGQANYGRYFVAVSYIKYKTGEIIYSAPCVRSIEQIAAASS